MIDSRMASAAAAPSARTRRARLLRWQIGYGTFGVPQAAAPIIFALLALPVTGSPEFGAAMVFAMTVAQVAGAAPVTRLGRRVNPVRYLRLLIAIRTLASAAMIAVSGASGSPILMIVAAAAIGVVNGAAYGYQRLVLNYFVEERNLPRALGVAATLNEVTFAASPVIASVVGGWSPLVAMTLITVLGMGPMLLMPAIPRSAPKTSTPRGHGRLTRLPAQAYVWYFAAAAGSAVVAAIEVGAVSFALRFGFEPAWAFLFALALCTGSIAGGVLVSIRNRTSEGWKVVSFLAATTLAVVVVALSDVLAVTLVAAAVIGFFLPMLGTHYSLMLDILVPVERRAEAFAHLRTANALGIITISGVIAIWGLHASLLAAVGMAGAACALTLGAHRLDLRAVPRRDPDV